MSHEPIMGYHRRWASIVWTFGGAARREVFLIDHLRKEKWSDKEEWSFNFCQGITIYDGGCSCWNKLDIESFRQEGRRAWSIFKGVTGRSEEGSRQPLGDASCESHLN